MGGGCWVPGGSKVVSWSLVLCFSSMTRQAPSWVMKSCGVRCFASVFRVNSCTKDALRGAQTVWSLHPLGDQGDSLSSWL